MSICHEPHSLSFPLAYFYVNRLNRSVLVKDLLVEVARINLVMNILFEYDSFIIESLQDNRQCMTDLEAN